MNQTKIEQPPIGPGKMKGTGEIIKRQIFHAGSKRSQMRLATLKFDPIEELVNIYRDIQEEVDTLKKIKSGEIIEMTAAGNRKAFDKNYYLKLNELKISVGEKLLRYGYGRVPETVNVNDTGVKRPLLISLTKDNEQYSLGESSTIEDDEDYDD